MLLSSLTCDLAPSSSCPTLVQRCVWCIGDFSDYGICYDRAASTLLPTGVDGDTLCGGQGVTKAMPVTRLPPLTPQLSMLLPLVMCFLRHTHLFLLPQCFSTPPQTAFSANMMMLETCLPPLTPQLSMLLSLVMCFPFHKFVFAALLLIDNPCRQVSV